METMNLSQLTNNEDGIRSLGEKPFSGFAIETFPDGSLQTQMSLMHGREDGFTRRWHPNGQLESEKSFRQGARTDSTRNGGPMPCWRRNQHGMRANASRRGSGTSKED